MRWNVKGVNKILVIKWSFLMKQVSLCFNKKKMPGKRVSKNIIQLIYFNYYKGKSAKEIADMFSMKIRTVYNIISRAENEGWLDLKGSTDRPKKVKQRVERKIIKTVYDSPQSSTRALALQVEKDVFLMQPSEMFLKNTNILQEWLGKKPYRL